MLKRKIPYPLIPWSLTGLYPSADERLPPLKFVLSFKRRPAAASQWRLSPDMETTRVTSSTVSCPILNSRGQSLFMCLLTICISSFVVCTLFHCLLLGVLYIFRMWVFRQMYALWTFSSNLWLVYSFSWCWQLMSKSWKYLMKSNLSIFSFMITTF